jgi:hypothetical protein
MAEIAVTPEWVQGAVSFEQRDGWIKPWRLVFERRELFYPSQGLGSAAEKAAGVRLRFETDSSVVTLNIEPEGEERPLDLTCGPDIVQSAILSAGEGEVTFGGLRADPAVYEIWLPQAGVVRLQSLAVPDNAFIRPGRHHRPRWVAYGSSITQCGGAHSPARTWPGIAARAHDLHLTCLGYGGNCDCDPVVAEMIADLPADVITLKLGINIMAHNSFSPRTYQPAVIGMVRTIRRGHPLVPIGVVTAICSPPREQAKNAVGMSLSDYRTHTAEAVLRLRDFGDEHVHLFDGLDLLGPEDAGYLPDDTHPNADGYELIGRRAAENVLPVLLDELA